MMAAIKSQSDSRGRVGILAVVFAALLAAAAACSSPRAESAYETLQMDDVSATIQEVVPGWYPLAQSGGQIGQDGYVVRYTLKVTGSQSIDECDLPVLHDDDAVLSKISDVVPAIGGNCNPVEPGAIVQRELFTELDLQSGPHDFLYTVRTTEHGWKRVGTVTITPEDVQD